MRGRWCCILIALMIVATGFVPKPHTVFAQDATPIPVVVTVILVPATETPTLTPTSGDTPTPTPTPTATPQRSQELIINTDEESGISTAGTLHYEISAGEAAIVILLFAIFCTQIVQWVLRQRGIE